MLKRKALFWDVNEQDLDRVFAESDDWVILRIVEYGTIEDIFELIDFYGSLKVKEVLTTNSLSQMSAAMAFLFFRIDKNNTYAS